MKVSLKLILAFTFLMLSYSISGNAMSLDSCISKADCSCQLSQSSSDGQTDSSINANSLGVDKSQSLSISDVELGFKSLSETYSSNFRLRRFVETNVLDTIHKFFLLREKLLVLDQSKSYYSDKDPHYSIICSDYYVFALRRILI